MLAPIMTFSSRAILCAAAATFWAASVICVNAAAFKTLPLIQSQQNGARVHITNAREAFLAKEYGKAKDEAKRAISLNKGRPDDRLLAKNQCRIRFAIDLGVKPTQVTSD